MATLDDNFKAINPETRAVVTFVRISDSKFKAYWNCSCHGAAYSLEYDEWRVKDYLAKGVIFKVTE